MNITIKSIGNGRTQATVVFDDKKVVDAAEEEVIQALGESFTVQGFRPGKAPVEKLREKLPPERVQEELIQRLVPGALQQILQENDIKPIVRPSVDMESNDPITLRITFVEKPEVKVDVKKLEKAAKKKAKEAKEAKDKVAPSDEKDAIQSQPQEDPNAKYLDLIVEYVQVDLAPELVQDEVREFAAEHAERLSQFGMQFEDWLKQSGKTIESFLQEVTPLAEKRVKLRFGITHLIDLWEIEVGDADMETKLQEIFASIPEEQKAQVQEAYKPGANAYEQMRFQYKVEKVFERLKGE